MNLKTTHCFIAFLAVAVVYLSVFGVLIIAGTVVRDAPYHGGRVATKNYAVHFAYLPIFYALNNLAPGLRDVVPYSSPNPNGVELSSSITGVLHKGAAGRGENFVRAVAATAIGTCRGWRHQLVG